MNTDEILDFIVKYYIWFVIGGFIIIMAIIGFIADRKKLFPTNKKNDKVKKIKKDEFDFDNDIPDDEEQLSANNADNQSEDEFKSDENTTDLKNSWNIESDLDVNSSKEINENNDETTEDVYSNYSGTNYENNITDENYTQENYYENRDSEQIDSSVSYDDNSLDRESENELSNEVYENQYEDDLYQEKVQEIREDINKIDDMFPDKSNDILDEERNIDYKNTGDNPEQTLQVNYSQLREMVEDIIAETQNENSQKNVDEDKFETDNQTVQDIPLPNLDHISVDAIKAQDEDEDDVWKF